MRIADAVYAVEDAIEYHIVDQILDAASKDKRDRIGFFSCLRGLKNHFSGLVRESGEGDRRYGVDQERSDGDRCSQTSSVEKFHRRC